MLVVQPWLMDWIVSQLLLLLLLSMVTVALLGSWLTAADDAATVDLEAGVPVAYAADQPVDGQLMLLRGRIYLILLQPLPLHLLLWRRTVLPELYACLGFWRLLWSSFALLPSLVHCFG